MTVYEVNMQHSEDTFEKLAHMQYDLFCTGNRVGRTLLSVVLITTGAVNFSNWWGVLVAAYGCYLITSSYSAANHTAHKLAAQIKSAGLEFPSSLYQFDDRAMRIVSLPDREKVNAPLLYGDVVRLGEDADYFYIFRDQYGGYMIPKTELGERVMDFRGFIEGKTRLRFRFRTAPVIRLLNRIYTPRRL